MLDDRVLNALENRQLLTRMVGGEFCCTVGAAFVVVHGVTVRCAAVKRVHETAGPLAVGTSWAASHQEWLRAPVFANVDGELPVQIGINFGPHVAAATPVFIADAPIANAKWFGGTVLDALFCDSASRRHVAVFDPIPQLMRSAAADVAGKIRLGAEQAAQADEFMGAETPVFDIPSPMDIYALGTMLKRANAVAPVIIVGIAATRPA